jgi:hypothetical protein
MGEIAVMLTVEEVRSVLGAMYHAEQLRDEFGLPEDAAANDATAKLERGRDVLDRLAR